MPIIEANLFAIDFFYCHLYLQAACYVRSSFGQRMCGIEGAVSIHHFRHRIVAFFRKNIRHSGVAFEQDSCLRPIIQSSIAKLNKHVISTS